MKRNDPLMIILLVVFLACAARADDGGGGAPINVLVPRDEAFVLLSDTEDFLLSLRDKRQEDVQEDLATLQDLRTRLTGLRQRADGFLSQPIPPEDVPLVESYNAEAQASLEELKAFYGKLFSRVPRVATPAREHFDYLEAADGYLQTAPGEKARAEVLLAHLAVQRGLLTRLLTDTQELTKQKLSGTLLDSVDSHNSQVSLALEGLRDFHRQLVRAPDDAVAEFLEGAERALAPFQDDESTAGLFGRARSLGRTAAELSEKAGRLRAAEEPSAQLVMDVRDHNGHVDDLQSSYQALAGTLKELCEAPRSPQDKDFEVLANAAEELGKSSGRPDAEKLSSELAVLRPLLQELKAKAEELRAAPFAPELLTRVVGHNLRCERILANTEAFRLRFEAFLAKRNQSPPPPVPPASPGAAIDVAVFRKTATSLVDGGKYKMKGKAESQCNLFLDAFAAGAFGYEGFRNLRANDIARRLRDPGTYRMPFTPVTGEKIEERLARALALANEGRFVVVACEEKVGSGHVAVVMPGEPVPSGSWGFKVPPIAQAGMTTLRDKNRKVTGHKDNTFAGKGLNYGFGADLKGKIEIYVYTPVKAEEP